MISPKKDEQYGVPQLRIVQTDANLWNGLALVFCRPHRVPLASRKHIPIAREDSMARMRLPIACFLLSLLNFDAPRLRIHQRDCLILLALYDEPENAFRP